MPQPQFPLRQASAVVAEQISHAPPLVPHALVLVPVRHWLPSQQPVGHELASQMHAPASHRCPSSQLGPNPHWHSPFDAH